MKTMDQIFRELDEELQGRILRGWVTKTTDSAALFREMCNEVRWLKERLRRAQSECSALTTPPVNGHLNGHTPRKTTP